MAPESASNNPSNPAAATRLPAGQSVQIPAPAAGQALTVNSSPSGKLDFAFDPTQNTSMERVANSLVFKTDTGGTVTVNDFFAVGDQSLPALTLPDGTVIPADFLTAAGIDMTTAAGPGAGGAPGSGGTNYYDDAGNLIGGVDRLGSLGTDQWGRSTEAPEEYLGLNLAAGPAPSIIIRPIPPVDPEDPDNPTPPVDPRYTIEASGVNLTLDEAHLPEGSNAGAVSTTAKVSFGITSNDGVGALTLDGAAYQVQLDGSLAGFPAVGIAQSGGVLSNPKLINMGNGEFVLSFDYELTDAHHHEGAQQGTDTAQDVDSFSMSVTSQNGAVSGIVYVHVDIIDDVPAFIVADTAGSIQPGHSEIGTITLVEGADGANWSSFEVNGKAIAFAGDKAAVPFGNDTLELTRNGDAITYEYKAAKDSDSKDVKLNFSILDNDGDRAEAEVSLSVKDSPVTVIPSVGGSDLEVNEKFLDSNISDVLGVPNEGNAYEGTGQDNKDSWSDPKVVTFAAPDGLDTVTIQGTGGAVTLVVDTPVVIQGEHGSMEATLSYDTVAKTGSVSYKYLLEERAEHVDADGINKDLAVGEDAEDFTVVVTDFDGDRGEMTINVTIVDDVPTMTATDTDQVTKPGGSEIGSLTLAEGADGANWDSFTVNDKPIAFTDDKATVPFGDDTLILTRNGGEITYEYKVSDNSGTKSVPLTFKITDNDGDPVQAAVAIQITDTPPAITLTADGSAVKVFEKYLDSDITDAFGVPNERNTYEGRDEDDKDTWSAEKSFTFNAPDGLVSATINGVAIADGALIVGKYGTLKIVDISEADAQGNYTVKYEYLLEKNAVHANADGRNEVLADKQPTEDFKIVVTDKGAAAPAEATLTVTIVDDVPMMTATGQTTIQPGHTATGTVTLVEGADGADWTTFTLDGEAVSFGVNHTATVATQYGDVTLTDNQDGTVSYSYKVPASALDGTDYALAFAIKDNDGDPATAQVDFAVKDSPVIVIPSVGGSDLEVNERFLDSNISDAPGVPNEGNAYEGTGQDNKDTWSDSKVMTFAAPDGLDTVTIQGTGGAVTLVVGTPVVIQGEHGSMEATLSYDTVAKIGSVSYKYLLEERVEHVDADGINKDLAVGEDAENFKVVVTDLDGDRGEMTINVTIVDDVPTMTATDTDQVTKPGGSEIGSLTLAEGADGANWNSFTVNDTPIAFTNDKATVPFGADTLILTRNGGEITYEYKVSDNSGTKNVPLTFKITDLDGDPVQAAVTIQITDTPPAITLTADGSAVKVFEKHLDSDITAASGVPNERNTYEGTAEDDKDTWSAEKSFTFNAPDGLVSATINGVAIADGALIAGKYGTLKIVDISEADAQGNYTVKYEYLLEKNAVHANADGTNEVLADKQPTEDFKIVVTDKGAAAPAEDTLTVTIVDDVPTMTATDTEQVTKPGGSEIGSLTLAEGADGANWNSFTVNDTPIAFTNDKATVPFGADTLILTRNGGEITYEYKVSDNSGTKNVPLTFKITDLDGDPVQAAVTIQITDTAPAITLTADGSAVKVFEKYLDSDITDASGVPNERNTYEGTAEDDKDTWSAEKSFTFNAPDGLVSATINGVAIADGALIAGKYGTLKIVDISEADAQGNYTVKYEYLLEKNAVHANAGGPNEVLADGQPTEDFKIVVTDKGAAAPAEDTLTVTIVDDVPEAHPMDAIYKNASHVVLEGILAELGADGGAKSAIQFNIQEGVQSEWIYKGEAVQLGYDGVDKSVVIGTATVDGQKVEVFRLEGHTDGTYTFTQSVALDSSRTETNVIHKGVAGSIGGNTNAMYIMPDPNPSDAIIATVTKNDPDNQHIVKITGVDGKGGSVTVNSNNHTMGADGGGRIGTDNTIILTPRTNLTPGDGIEDIYTSVFTIGVTQSNGGVTSDGVVSALAICYALDGSGLLQPPLAAVVNDNGSITVTAPEGYYIDHMEITSTDANAGVASISAGTTTIVETDVKLVGLEIPFTATDSDGDAVSGAVSFTPQVEGDITAPADHEDGFVLHGGASHDTLHGSVGDDIIQGGQGDDIIHGGQGDDILFGGEGHDTFTWTASDYTDGGTDKIMDFSFGEDKLRFNDLLANDSDHSLSASDIATLITAGKGGDTAGLHITADSGVVTIEHGGQAIEIHSNMSTQQVTALTGDNADAAAQVLINMLVTTG